MSPSVFKIRYETINCRPALAAVHISPPSAPCLIPERKRVILRL